MISSGSNFERETRPPAGAAVITMDSGPQSAGTIKLGRVLGYIAIVLWVLGMIVRLGGLLAK